MLSVSHVANYFLTLQDEDAGDLISNLKLQKLLYYAQGLHLAINDGQPLFDEPIEAWTHGPVVSSLYHQFKIHGSGPIPRQDNLDLDVIDEETRNLLNEIYSVFGQFSAWKLRNMTHDEPPWKNVEDQIPCEIQRGSMQEYFTTQLV